jgi:hypothetical protein
MKSRILYTSLSLPQVLEWVNSGRALALEFPVTADGQCDAVAAWFKLYLGDHHLFTLF